MTENSATTTVQHQLSVQFKNRGYHQVWSPPVPPHFAHQRDDTAVRGMASGVSFHSKYPCRNSRIPISPEIDPTRFLSVVVQIAEWSFHCVVLYGYPSSLPQSKTKTCRLVHEAMQAIEQVGLPALILGDINHHPADLPPCQALQHMGYTFSSDLYQQLHGRPMPPTCRNATTHDQILFHPAMHTYVRDLQVDQQYLFHDHNPVVATLQLPVVPPQQQVWNMPKSWVQFEPQGELVAKHFDEASSQHDIPTSHQPWTPQPSVNHLRIWSEVCEQAIDRAIHEQHLHSPDKYPQSRLPRACKGRCIPRQLITKDHKMPIKQACHGQYNPPAECISFRILHWTKQTRRVQSLRNLVRKTEQGYATTSYEQLQMEWNAIGRAKGFGSFAKWCAYQPELGCYPYEVPSLDYLDTLAQLLQYHTDAKTRAELALKQKNARYHKYYDQQHNHLKQTIGQIKGNAHPSLTMVNYATSAPAQLLLSDQGFIELQLDAHVQFTVGQPATYDSHPCVVHDQEDSKISLMLEHADATLSPRGDLVQQHTSQASQHIFHQLDEFWSQFWKRDSPQESDIDQHWSDFKDLVASIPPLPPVQINLEQTEDWIRALSKQKSGTARGYDGWHSDELKSLPRTCIHSPSRIFAEQPPQSILHVEINHAVTLPLGKKPDSDTAAQTRPITLLPLVYRLWARVISQQILTQWIPHMPVEIIGFLPGRSPQRYLTAMQFELEKNHTRDPSAMPQWQGATLDLVKCFNLIPRAPARYALEQAGIPSRYVSQWLHTLNELQRWWKVHDDLHCAGPTTTGAPEGDSWSVLACVALSRLWVELVRQDETSPYCYADNWAWRSLSTPANLHSIALTKTFTNSLRLKIDWSKTWIWFSGSTPSPQWLRDLQAACDAEVEVAQVHVARELGYTIHYNKQHSRATQRARHEQALEYIHRAKQPQLTLDSRAKLCHYAMTKALWGTETYVVGQSWFQQLRAAMAKTLVPDKSHSNSHVAAMLLSKHLVDPELYHIQQCVRTCRNMLVMQRPAEQSKFFQIASCHSTRHYEVWGPSGTLAYNLGKLAWSVRADGCILTDTMLQLHLLESSQEDIMSNLEDAWLRHLVQCNMQRPEWTHLPIPNRRATLQVIKSTPQAQHKTIAQAITGASMLASQIQHFGESDEKCALCGEVDSYVHRALECTSTADVRSKFQDIVDMYDELNPCHVTFPVVYMHPHHTFNQWHFANRPTPSLTDDANQKLNHEIASQGFAVFYTDGSCDHPHDPSARRAACAAVLQQQCPLDEQQAQVNQWIANGTIPPAYHVCLLAEVNGKQSIPRAELQIIAHVAALEVPTQLWTDSQYACDIVDFIKRLPSLPLMHTRRNFDVLRQLWQFCRRSDFVVRKIKAHALNVRGDSHSETWHKLGNHAADQAAKQYLQHLHRTQPLLLQPDETKHDMERCRQWYAYLHDLQVERAKLFQVTIPEPPIGHRLAPWSQQYQSLQTWNPPNTWSFVNLPDYQDLLPYSVWGSQYTDLLLQWFSQVQWPDTEGDFDPHGLGITWSEMALSFVFATHYGIMVNSGGQHASFRPELVPPNIPRVPWSIQVASFERAVRSLQTKLEYPLFPDLRVLAKSYRVMGGDTAKHGIRARPKFPYQSEVVDSLAKHISAERNQPGMVLVPEVTDHPRLCTLTTYADDETDLAQGWHLRVNRARQHRRG
eukprot:Skav208855  [mRNA]  locus=scaffold2996:279682:284739:+ [translate_table: standard]